VYPFGRHLIWVLLVREVIACLTAVRALGSIFFTSCDWLGWVTIGRGSSGVGKSWQGIAVPSNRYEASFGGVVLGGCASRTIQSACMRVDASQFHASVCPFLTKLSTA